MVKRYFRFLSVALPVMLFAGCANPPFAPVAIPDRSSIRDKAPKKIKVDMAELLKLQNVTPGSYVLGAGDSFNIAVYGDENLSRAAQILPDGTISIAPIGSVKLVGLTLEEAAAVLEKRYRKFVKECSIVIEPVQFRPYSFTIGGAVMAPGNYPFAFGSFRLTDAVAAARGLQTTEGNLNLSDLENAYIVRNGKVLPIDFTKALVDGEAIYNIPILDKDYIFIPSLETGKITMLGELGAGCFPYQPDMTLLQAIGLAGGLEETYSREIKIIRGGLKNPEVFTVNVKEIQLGQARDIALKPRDIVYVPKDPISEWNVIMGQILPSIQFLNGLAGPFGSPSSFLYKD